MPPSPRIEATVNPVQLAIVCKQLRIDKPPIRIVPATGGTVNGSYHPATGKIDLYVGFDGEAMSALRHMQSRVVRTLLHELRHAYQYTHWTVEAVEKGHRGHYSVQEIEEDARHFADTHSSRWRNLVIVRRRQHGSGFSKLARHATHRNV